MADGQHAVPSSGDRAVDEQTEGNASLRPLKQSLQAWPSRVAASILAFALLVALGWSSWQSTRELIESNRWVSNTLEVLYELEQLRSNIISPLTKSAGSDSMRMSRIWRGFRDGAGSSEGPAG